MMTAGIMLAHQVAAKAFRDATFLTAWPATALPLMMVATATATIALVPIFSRLLDRFSPLAVVAAGFALSALGHAAEWALFDGSRWIAVAIYLHLAAAGAVLLSGFWSLVSERFDPAGARAAYGRINAAGTMGGIAGSVAAERIAATISPDSVLLLLAMLHVICAGGVAMMRRAPALLPRRPDVDEEVSGVSEIFRSSYLRTIASFVVMASASSAILDFLLKSSAQASFGAGPDLLRFFALFYGAVQVLSFFAQTRSGQAVKRLGIGGTINALPGGITAASIIALIFPGWIAITALRAFESVLRTSLFRSGYELLFVPMDFRHAPPREGDSRRHMRSRRRGGWIRNRSTAPLRGRRVDDEQPADRVVHSRRRVVVVGTTIRSALSESHRTRARKVPRGSTGQPRVGSRLDAVGRAGEFSISCCRSGACRRYDSRRRATPRFPGSGAGRSAIQRPVTCDRSARARLVIRTDPRRADHRSAGLGRCPAGGAPGPRATGTFSPWHVGRRDARSGVRLRHPSPLAANRRHCRVASQPRGSGGRARRRSLRSALPLQSRDRSHPHEQTRTLARSRADDRRCRT